MESLSTGDSQDNRKTGRVVRSPAIADPKELRRQIFELYPEQGAKVYGIIDATSIDSGSTTEKPRRPRIAGVLTPPVIEDSELKADWDAVHGIIDATENTQE